MECLRIRSASVVGRSDALPTMASVCAEHSKETSDDDDAGPRRGFTAGEKDARARISSVIPAYAGMTGKEQLLFL